MSDRKCEWCGAVVGLLPAIDECVDVAACSSRILKREHSYVDDLRALLVAMTERAEKAERECDEANMRAMSDGPLWLAQTECNALRAQNIAFREALERSGGCFRLTDKSCIERGVDPKYYCCGCNADAVLAQNP